jgi:hypothetical protein
VRRGKWRSICGGQQNDRDVLIFQSCPLKVTLVTPMRTISPSAYLIAKNVILPSVRRPHRLAGTIGERRAALIELRPHTALSERGPSASSGASVCSCRRV